MKIFALLESYSYARDEFYNAGDNMDEINNFLSRYKKLNVNHKIKGSENDINYWASKGFDTFKNFVIKIENEPSRTQLKRRRVRGKYITLIDDNEYLIVIPLNLEASCFYGKNTRWCTTKETRAYFSDYLRKDLIILVYILKKDTNEKYALAYDQINDFAEYYDSADIKMLRSKFKSVTGIDPQKIINMLKSKPIKTEVREILNKTKNDDVHLKMGNLHKGIRDPAIEKMITKYASPRMAYKYIQMTNTFPEDMISLIAKSPNFAYDYAKNYTNGSGFPQGEAAIATNQIYSYYYAKNVLHGGRFKLGEPAIEKDGQIAKDYAKDIILGKFPEGEAAIAKNGYASFEYAMNVLHHRFPAGEDVIKHDAADWLDYKREFKSEFK